jgi:hypothetical protein
MTRGYPKRVYVAQGSSVVFRELVQVFFDDSSPVFEGVSNHHIPDRSLVSGFKHLEHCDALPILWRLFAMATSFVRSYSGKIDSFFLAMRDVNRFSTFITSDESVPDYGKALFDLNNRLDLFDDLLLLFR